AAALNHYAIFRSVFVVDQMLGTRDEVGEGGGLVHHAAGVAPGLAHLSAAADVSAYINNSAFQQRQTAGRKSWRNRNTVRSIAVQQRGRRTVELHGLAINDGH